MLLLVMIVGTAGFMHFDDRSLLDSIYMNIVTISTVGYGDLKPESPESKYLVLFVIIMGVGSFVGVLTNATEMMIVKRESRQHQKKINMVIGVFFSEVGTQLLSFFCDCDKDIDEIRNDLIVKDNWNEIRFKQIHEIITGHNFNMDVTSEDLVDIRQFLMGKRAFMVRLLENPVLFEHERFTSLLREVFHVTEELSARSDITKLPLSDLRHVANDIKNGCIPLVHQWLDYMYHLRKNYPNLFSFSARINPFVKERSPVVVE